MQRFDVAIVSYERQLSIATQLGYPNGKADALGQLAEIYAEQKRPRKALQLYRQCLDIVRAIRNRPAEATCLWSMSSLLDDLGELSEALGFAQQAVNLYAEIGDERAGTAGELLEYLQNQSRLRPKLNRLLSKFRFREE
jgi:tetratricopeptide (TPR) repeat protein